MAIQDLTDGIILVDAPSEPDLNVELKNVSEVVRHRGDCDVVIDFSQVDIITSPSLSKLLKLRKLLLDCGHRLILCSVARSTRGIFSVTALEDIFDMVADRSAAQASLANSAAMEQL